jgi:hypothetical protein
VQDLSPSICRPIPHGCENNHAIETDAPSSTSILFTLLNTTRLRGLGSLSRSSSGQTCNRRVQTRQTLIHNQKNKTSPPQGGPANIRTTIARLPRKGLRSMLARSAFPTATTCLQMEVDGIEPTTPCLQSRCSPTELHPQETQSNESFCFFFQKEALFFFVKKNQKTSTHKPVTSPPLVGQGGFEPPTPRLSSVCSNQLSYWPNTTE